MTFDQLFNAIFQSLATLSALLIVRTESNGYFAPTHINDIVDKSCFVGFNSLSIGSISEISDAVKSIFKDDLTVTVGVVDLGNFVWKPGRSLQYAQEKSDDFEKDLVIFPQRKVDRTCLMTNNLGKPDPQAEIFTGVLNLQNIVEFINIKCNAYRNVRGDVSIEGLHRLEILRTMYRVGEHTDISSKQVFIAPVSTDHKCSKESVCQSKSCDRKDQMCPESKKYHKKYAESSKKMLECDRIPMPSKDVFFHNYLKVSKPVIITGAIDSWKALSKWTNDFFKENYGNRNVHIKLTPHGEFEGVEPASLFENYEDFRIPETVFKQLPYPDLVVVRPAVANVNLSQFIDAIEQVSNGSRTGFSAYLEYSSLADNLPELEEDIEEMPFFDNMLKLEHTNLWLSDGNTLGKLHFDPFDNFLCQLRGRKEVILFEPQDNTRLYEAHIPEAMLYYNSSTRIFHRKELVDTTSMVMSPVDLHKPDFERFPKFADTFPLNCTIAEGEVLFMPAFWWHEVQSHPNIDEGRNLAVNFWYEPFLMKEFPCAECQLDINPKYRHLL